MNKNKSANQGVKERLLAALVGFSGKKDWSKVTVTEVIEASGVARASFYRNFKSVGEIIDYAVREMSFRYHEGKPSPATELYDRELMRYKFRFYREHAVLVLAFHHARASTTLLGLITDCEIEAYGDMPASSISRYALYYYSGAFYNMLLCWLESGMRESPEAMADEYLRLVNGVR